MNDDSGDSAVSDIHQTVVTVPEVRYRNVFANVMAAVRCFLQLNIFGLILC
ncbi:hypothetical protein DPMN_168897 [Dreissena polymorpha]|uniref:Uncharacterized protein n=1 Tax=Dreissena polymorpha TaxID=45954 RepID=A0A9D4F1K1_DREPO|nr:hypothetical protein DPMN_168897 [Dreissena polymorpha]